MKPAYNTQFGGKVMRTDKIQVSSDGKGMEKALQEAERFAKYMELDHKAALQVRLLIEETLGMVKAITQDFSADLWLESTSKGGCRIHLLAETDMDYVKKRELVAVSSSGKNEASRGIMGKIRDLIENGLYSVDEAGDLLTDYSTGPVKYASIGMCDLDAMTSNSMIYMWSLNQYRSEIDQERKSSPAAEEAWDELEKSIVANIADDVRVSVSGSEVELTIIKNHF